MMPRWPYRIIGATLDRVFRNNMNDNFKDIEEDFKEQKARVDNFINSQNQADEAKDIRVDDEGKIHPTARDSILFMNDKRKKK